MKRKIKYQDPQENTLNPRISQRPIPHRIIVLLRLCRLLLSCRFIYKHPSASSLEIKHPRKRSTHTRLRTCRPPNLPLPSVPIIPHIPRPKNAIQQPTGDPIRAVFAIRRPTLEQAAHQRRCIVADLEDRPALAVRADVVPEERGAGCWVGAHVVKEVGGV